MERKTKDVKAYFPHDANARNSDKLIRLRMIHKAQGYGVYFMILERLREEPNYMSLRDYDMIAFDLREDTALIRSVVEDFGLFSFTEDGQFFYSDSFTRRMDFMDEKSRRRAEAGKKGQQNRWGKRGENDQKPRENESENDSNAITKLPENDSNAITKLPENDSNAITKLPENDSNAITKLPENDSNKNKQKEKKQNKKELLHNSNKQQQEKENIGPEKNEEKTDAEKESQKEAQKATEKEQEKEYTSVAAIFNAAIRGVESSLRPVRKLTPERRQAIARLLVTYPLDEIREGFRAAANSAYLNGRTKDRTRPADFDWIIRPENFLRILERTI